MNKPVLTNAFDADAAAGPKGGRDAEAVQQTKIGRAYRFEAAHYLPLVPEGHRCRNLHGHNYRVEVLVSGALDSRGFVLDFAELDALMEPVLSQVDHRLLNDVKGLENPTAEIIAAWFLNQIPHCERVRVYENDDCWAEVARQRR
jgi:6-pyruvoyltetrahydropterin/6-carboxytetrahydropterin synthase